MRVPVVHHYDVTAPQLRQQLLGEPAGEAVPTCALELCAENHPAAEPNRAEQGQVLAPVRGHALDEFHTALYPCVATSHRAVQSGLVEEYEPLRSHPRDRSQVLLA